MGFKLTDHVTWVGKIDWELKKFHGEEYSTDRGSSYNAYLVRDEKTVLIDTVWLPYDDEFVAKLKKEIDLKDIDYIIANHSEVDHSGALPELLREIPDTPVYCTANGAKMLKAHYHEDWNFVEVKTGDKLNLGSREIIFVEAPMLHWPDSMFSYLTGDNILFSNDAFGQHFASEMMYNSKVDQAELYQEALKYYANILTPFSPLVTKKIKEVLAFNLPVDMIAPSHGIIWKDDPAQIIHKYLEWADSYQENQITLVYDTMWDATRTMAQTIAEGIKSVDQDVVIKRLNTGKLDKNDIVSEIFKSKAILMGSPTINNGILSSTAAMIEMIKGLKFKNKKFASFGSYGWSGEGVKIIDEELEKTDMNKVLEGLKIKWKPDDEAKTECYEFGREFAKALHD
ncbi:anaerobic nitric oxide reductase flavorubredoxin [Fusibacter sp. JL216-2]|uniref:anaerobic nitric oxide reductase flavorubredoxin n=1 Tax=Fusibacter sp. JL216-2 TaxID=3071453 RepID=UPI003D34C16F